MDTSMFKRSTLIYGFACSAWRNLCCLLCLLGFSCPAGAADVNLDTPNLSFESGNFSNWNIYTGGYYFDLDDSQFKYEWTQTDKASERHKIMNSIDTPDPIIACSDFLVVPKDLSLTARIGAPGKTENCQPGSNIANRCKFWKAAAERMTYSFVVTENTTLLSYRFACALFVPDNDSHSGNQLPMFMVYIHVINPETSEESVLPCGSYEAKASDANSGLERNPKCKDSQAGTDATQYVFRNWTSGSLNLSKFLGYRVEIEIINRDCLVDNSKATNCEHAANMTGGHDSYGYFWAETRKLELVDRNCGQEDATIIAPAGFNTYVWERSDGKPIATVPGSPHIASIPRNSLSDGIDYSCTVSSDLCSAGTVTTKLQPVKVNVAFSAEDSCGGKVKFTNSSTAEGDEIVGYNWSFGDSTYSLEDNPVHYYGAGDSYLPKLIATTKLGCTDSVELPVVVPYFPVLAIDGLTSACYGDNVKLTLMDVEVGSSILWSTGETGQVIDVVAQNSDYYKVKVTDKRSCSYETQTFLSVKPNPNVFITGTPSVCLGDTTMLTAHNGASYVWSTGVSDTNSITVRPLAATQYIVQGRASNGCVGFDTVTVEVNALPVVAIDGPDEVCSGTKGVLTASGADTYIWKDLYAGAEREILPTEATRYEVRGTDGNGCSSSASKVVSVKENPVLTFVGDTLICAGDIARITVNGASSFRWFDGSTNNFYSKVLQNDTVWTVTGAIESCVGSLSIPIKIKPSPFVYISGPAEVCTDDELVLVGNGAESYSWATGEVTDTLKTMPNVSATYQVTGKAANGCVRIATLSVKVLPVPSVSIVGDASVCLNTLAKLKAVGDATVYYWSNGSISDSIMPLISQKQTFSVEGQDLHGCRNTASFTVGTIDPPALGFTGDTLICSGRSTVLVASGASAYEWNNGVKTAICTVSPKSDTIYSFKGTLNGCTAQLAVPVHVLQSPTIWAEGYTEICFGDTLVLLGKGADTYLWSNGTQGETLKAMPQSSSIVKLTGIDANDCRAEIEIPVSVRLKPRISISGDQEVCTGTAASLQANGECILFSWSNGDVGQNIYPIISQPTDFTVTGTDKYNCTNTAVYRVTPVLPPSLSFLGDTAVCLGNYVDLVGQGAVNYVWDDSIPGSEYSFKATANTYVKLRGEAHNCSAERMITVNVLTPPNILISGDTAVCPGERFTITAQGAPKFRWSTGDTTASISYAPQVATTYYATGENAFGCVTTKSFTVGVRSLPSVSISLLSYRGCPGGKDTAVVRANGAEYYEWSSEPALPEVDRNLNSNKLAVLLSDTTTLYLYGRDLFGCENETELKLKPLPRQTISFNIEPKWIEHSNPTISMKGVSPAEASWVWNAGDGTAEQQSRLFHHRYNIEDLADSVLVSVTAVDTMGCVYKGEEYLFVMKDFWAPTGFTPNADEKNENFHFFGGKYIDNFHFYIFNRQGEIVFEGHNFEDAWDGTYKGKECPWGVYGWVATYSSSVKGTNFSGEKKGFVTIVR